MSRETVAIRRGGKHLKKLSLELFGTTARGIKKCEVGRENRAPEEKDEVGCLDPECATSVGAYVWLKSRLMEKGAFNYPQPDEPDDTALWVVKTHDGQEEHHKLVISPVARSKMFTTPLVVEPINLTTLRVAKNF